MAEQLRNNPIPQGLTLDQTLRLRAGRINSIAWSPNGRWLAVGSADRTVRLLNAETGAAHHVLEGHGDWVRCVAWSADSWTLASGSDDGSVRLWDAATGILQRTFRGRFGVAHCVAWSPLGLVAAGFQDGMIRLWDAESGALYRNLEAQRGEVYTLAWSPYGRLLASGGEGRAALLWNVETGKIVHSLSGHTERVTSIGWSSDGNLLATACGDPTIRLWDAAGRHVRSLEGHQSEVTSLNFSSDGSLLASATEEETRFWDCKTWNLLSVLDKRAFPDDDGGTLRLTFNPGGSRFATLGEGNTIVRLWSLDTDALLKATQADSVHYTNAKVVLVGDSGVGKSGLGLVLSGQPFAATESTHGRRVWTLKEEEVEIENGLKETHETLLWDLAGQPGYRLIHQLHLDEVAVALVVFDSRSETDLFGGIHHWNRALRQAQRVREDSALPMKKILVAARVDREGVGAGPGRIESLVRDLGFDAYFETSAKEGWNVAALTEAIHAAIPWEALPRVSSTHLFQRIKAFLLAEKEARRLLSTVEDLYRAFLKSGEAVPVTETLRDQFETCIGLVESRGLIRRLSFGNLVLLQPELLDAYASSLVNAAKEEPEGLGCIAEEDARAGRFRIPEDERIHNREQEKLLLVATVEDLLRHEIALREHADDGPLLVFPSQFTREYPILPDPEGKAVTIAFEGPILSVYATLAVRLSHSGIFRRDEMWRNAATYTALTGGTCGMYLRETGEGQGELTLFFDAQTSREIRSHFESYVLAHLKRRSLPESVKHRRAFACGECGFVVTEQLRKLRAGRGFDWLDCPVCGERIALEEGEERTQTVPAAVLQAMDREADARREYDAGLVSATAEMQTRSFKRWVGSSKTTLALVFTDMVDSTGLGSELGNEIMGQIRRAHFARARALVAAHKGYEIKTIGDAFMAAFRTAVEAFDFASALYTDPGHERIRIRAGIHIGPVEIDEQDVWGTAVNYASRVVDFDKEQAKIHLSDEARSHIEQVRPITESALRWMEHADCELKGLPGRHRIWSVSRS